MKQNHPRHPLWNKHQVSEHLNIPTRSVIDLARAGVICAYEIPGRRGFLFRSEEIEALPRPAIRQQAVGEPAQPRPADADTAHGTRLAADSEHMEVGHAGD